MASWHWVDYAIVAVIALSVLTGLIRGFVKELIALSVWIIAGWLSFMYAKPVSLWLATYIQDTSVRVVVSYVLIIVGTLLAGGLVTSMISFIMHRTGLSGTDRLLGLGFGLVRGVFVVSLLMVVVKLTGMPEDEYRQKSKLYAHFSPVVSWMYQYAPDMMKRVEKLEQKTLSSELEQHMDMEVKDFASL